MFLFFARLGVVLPPAFPPPYQSQPGLPKFLAMPANQEASRAVTGWPEVEPPPGAVISRQGLRGFEPKEKSGWEEA